MPSASDFRKAFLLAKGDTVGGSYEVQDAIVGHNVKQEYEKYEFPTTATLVLPQGAKPAAALAAFKAHVKEHKIVYSAYGSPYECSYAPAKVSSSDPEEGTVIISCMGKAVRRRDLPSLKEVKEKERKGQTDELSEGEGELLAGMRVIKSRFGTSKCSMCGEVIDPGVRIAKPAKAEGRGGWSHVRCVVDDIKRKQGLGDSGPGTPRKSGHKRTAAVRRKGERKAGAAHGGKGKRKAAAASSDAAGPQNRKKKARETAEQRVAQVGRRKKVKQ